MDLGCLCVMLLSGLVGAPSPTSGMPPTAPTTPPAFTDETFTPADKYLFIELFRHQVIFDEQGSVLASALIPRHRALVNVERMTPDFRAFLERARDLFEAHVALMHDDPDYRESRFGPVSRDLIASLGEKPSQRQGRTAAYAKLLAAGVYHRILERAGRSSVVAVPAIMPADPWGSDSAPYATAGDRMAANETFPASVLMFCYCAGVRDAGGTGLTISAGTDNLYRRAHEWLLVADAAYSQKFRQTLDPYVERAAVLDPMDIYAAAALTRDLRKALVSAGFAARIQEQAGLILSATSP